MTTVGFEEVNCGGVVDTCMNVICNFYKIFITNYIIQNIGGGSLSGKFGKACGVAAAPEDMELKCMNGVCNDIPAQSCSYCRGDLCNSGLFYFSS